MKESAQEEEIERLKKLAEKPKSGKESLQRDNRSLKGRLSTAQSNNAKCHSVLKKEERPNVGLDKETFEQLMNLSDDIITPVRWLSLVWLFMRVYQ